ncbi:hypothetical protein C7999DRAFT_36709, partial [Corynascus novoguineensis]
MDAADAQGSEAPNNSVDDSPSQRRARRMDPQEPGPLTQHATTVTPQEMMAQMMEMMKAMTSFMQNINNMTRPPAMPAQPVTPGTSVPRATEMPAVTVATSWKIKETGIFWPDADETTCGKQDIWYDKDQLCFRDIYLWTARIQDIVKDSPERHERLRREMWSLFRGSALQWYEQQLSATEKAALCVSVETWITRLKQEFGIKRHEAEAWLLNNRYTAQKNHDRVPVRFFAMECFKYARIWGDSTDIQLATRLYNHLHVELRQVCPEPSEIVEIGKYLSVIEAKSRVVGDKLREDVRNGRTLAPDRSVLNAEIESNDNEDEANWLRTNRQGSGNRKPWRRDQQPFPGYRSNHNPRRNPSGGRGSRTFGDHGREGQRHRRDQMNREDRKGPPRYKKIRKYALKRRYQDGSFSYYGDIWVSGDDEEATRQREILEKTGYVLVQEYDTPLDEEEDLDDEDEDTSFHTYHSTAMPTRQQVQQCTACNQIFDIRAALFEHASRPCDEPKVSPTDQAKFEDSILETDTDNDEKEAHLVFTEGQVVEAQPCVPRFDKTKQITYLRIKVKANPGDEGTEVCLDTGSNTNLADKEWISTWAKNPRWIEVEPHFIKGVGARSKISQQVEFDLYIGGRVRGINVEGHFAIRADVIEGLAAKLLIGTDFMMRNGVKIDLPTSTCSFRSVFNMKVKGRVTRPRAVRRVKAAQTAVISPFSEALITTDFLELPKPILEDK